MYTQGILSGDWNNEVKCGSRRSNWNNSPLNLNSNISARSVTDTEELCICREPYSPLADISTLLIQDIGLAKYTATAPRRLVVY